MIVMDGIREQFPILQQKIHGQPLAFLDTAASAQKPQAVIDAEMTCYQTQYANIHRGLYYLSEQTTLAYEAVREKVRQFINAEDAREIIFTSGTTASINLVAYSFCQRYLKQNDVIMISMMEHHANIVPWQTMCQAMGAELVVIPLTLSGDLDLEAYSALLEKWQHKVKLVAVTQVSNVLGTVNDIHALAEKAHAVGAKILVDGAQGVVHYPVNVKALDVDFYAFSSHKLYGPSGVGVLYGKRALLEEMPPYQTGGDMVDEVRFEKTTFASLPNKFEAGTPNIAGAIGLGAAIDWLLSLTFSSIHQHEVALLKYAEAALSSLPELSICGRPTQRTGVISFVLKDIHPHDVGTLLDHYGVAVRVGHHCAQPLIRHLNLPATVRMSLGVYNNSQDIDQLMMGLAKVIQLFKI